ncbi:MAG: DUF58 domain-containing protein [Clostridia bacterium]|nr:DUF58 domain-containing protein [Clostridia bacterium]
MKKRSIGSVAWLLLALCLYFFENNTGTRIVLGCSLLFALLPILRRLFFSPDHAERITRQPVTIQSFSYKEEADSGDVRLYQPGDPINRMHWKLSAKRNEWLIRESGPETLPRDMQAESAASRDAASAKPKKKRLLLFCLSALLLLLLCLFLLPSARCGAQALCNRLFEASEQANAYVYTRFPVPEDQSIALAGVLLALILSCLLGVTLLSGSRFMALCLMAGGAAFQMYFGLSFPAWLNVLLLAAFALWMRKRPWKCGDAFMLLVMVLAVSLTVALVWPGVDAATEAASERARDLLSQIVRQTGGTVKDLSQEAYETWHTHTQTLTWGEREARAEKEFRLETVEEEQVSMPRWIDYLRIALLLLLTAALLILPFLPFLWLNAHRKKALEARKAFSSQNAGEAVYAIFQQVIAWLEAMGLGAGNLPYREWTFRLPSGMQPGYEQRFSECAALFEEAAYSDHALSEEQRGQALSLLDETERALYARADWKQRLRLKYGDCLWIEKA